MSALKVWIFESLARANSKPSVGPEPIERLVIPRARRLEEESHSMVGSRGDIWIGRVCLFGSFDFLPGSLMSHSRRILLRLVRGWLTGQVNPRYPSNAPLLMTEYGFPIAYVRLVMLLATFRPLGVYLVPTSLCACGMIKDGPSSPLPVDVLQFSPTRRSQRRIEPSRPPLHSVFPFPGSHAIHFTDCVCPAKVVSRFSWRTEEMTMDWSPEAVATYSSFGCHFTSNMALQWAGSTVLCGST